MWYENGEDMKQPKSDNITDKGLFREAIIGPPPAMPKSIFYERPYKCRLCDRRFVVCIHVACAFTNLCHVVKIHTLCHDDLNQMKALISFFCALAVP